MRDDGMAQVAGMRWGIMGRLIAYVVGLSDGVIYVGEPVEVHGQTFWYPRTGDTDALTFEGSVRLRGHFGLLDIDLREPRVALDGDSGELSVRSEAEAGYSVFAELRRRSAPGDGGEQRWDASLTDYGAEVTGGVYAPGTPLEPVYFAASPPADGERVAADPSR